MKTIQFSGLLIFMIFSSSGSFGQSVEQALKEVNKSFTCKGEPIHPGLIREFEGFISDGKPITLTVDVLAALGTNEYFDKVKEFQSEFIIRPSEGGYYSYKHLGTVSDNIHVVRTYENMGGSMTWGSLMFITFDINKGFDYNGKIYDQLRMSVIKYYNITEGTSPLIKINKKSVEIKNEGDINLIEF